MVWAWSDRMGVHGETEERMEPMIIESRTATYLARVTDLIERGHVFQQMTDTCPECDRTLDQFNSNHHTVMINSNYKVNPHEVIILIACEGYWMINPNLVGIDTPNWTTMDGVLGGELPPEGSEG
jgi:hypothetical protein